MKNLQDFKKKISELRKVLKPEIIIETMDFKPSVILKPIFDSIWNACGYKGSFNYDSEGKRKTK